MTSLLRFKSVPVEQHGQVFYLFSAPAKTLFDILEINQRDSDKDEGYQRTLSAARVRSVSDFIDRKNVMAPAIVVSLEGAEFDEDSRELIIPQRENAGWVIDGQHRLAGAKEASKDVDLAVVAFLDLDTEKQIFQFVTINQTAKGVPKSLYYDLLKHLPPSKRPVDVAKDKAVDIATQLKRDEESPLYNRITVSPPQAGRSISLNNFVRKTAPLIQADRTPISVYNLQEQTKIIDNYFKGLREHEPSLFGNSPSIAFRTVGFGGLLNALPILFNLALKHFGGFRVVDVASVFNRVNFSFSNWEDLGSGNAAEIQAGSDLVEEARRAYETTGEIESGVIKL